VLSPICSELTQLWSPLDIRVLVEVKAEEVEVPYELLVNLFSRDIGNPKSVERLLSLLGWPAKALHFT
jgi:hypothetical protein